MNDVTSAKILFVEDEEAVLSSMKKFFDKQGFFTLGARSSEEALTLATRHKPDIAILDVMLHEGPEGQKMIPKIKKVVSIYVNLSETMDLVSPSYF